MTGLSQEQEREIGRIIGEACGAVSLAWDPRPSTQGFRSTEAGVLVDQAVHDVIAIVADHTHHSKAVTRHRHSSASMSDPVSTANDLRYLLAGIGVVLVAAVIALIVVFS